MGKINRYCSICGRNEDDTGTLINISNGINVCPHCMEQTMKMAEKLTFMDKPGDNPFGAWMNFMGNENVEEKAPWDSVDAPAGGPGMGSSEEDSPKCPADEVTDEDNGPRCPDDEAPDEEEGPKSPDEDPELRKFPGGFGIPNIGFLNMSDFQNMMFGGKTAPKKKDKNKKREEPIIDIKNIPLPHVIKSKLDDYVVGQEKAKKVMAVAVYNHYKRIAADGMKAEEFEDSLKDVEIEKSNVLLIGPTGCGKTYLVKTLAKLLDVPLAIADATSLTEAGYIGDDIESVVSKLLAAADNDVEKAETGIIFIDEIDKIAKKKNTNSRDVSGESVQQGMLKLLEGAEVEVPVGANSKNAMVPLATVDTRNIMFICGGAFPDLDEIIKQRLSKQTSIGFNAELKDTLDKRKDVLKEVTVEDIKKFGMVPEFVGRLPIIATMEGLTEEMLVEILNEPKNAIIKQYQKLLSIDEVKLEFTDEAMVAIAKKALEKETGARALRSIIEDIMLDIMYEIPKDESIGKVTITGDYINGTGGPVIAIRSNQ